MTASQKAERSITPTVSLTALVASHNPHCVRSYHVPRVVIARKTTAIARMTVTPIFLVCLASDTTAIWAAMT